MVTMGSKATEFELQGVYGGEIADYTLQSFPGKWLVLFFYPADFTFICPTEVTGFSNSAKDFRAEQAEVLGASIAPIETHRSWIDELGGVDYPLLSDVEKKTSRDYGVLVEKEGASARAPFTLNPAREVNCLTVSHMTVGRSVEQPRRVLKALRAGRLCPADVH